MTRLLNRKSALAAMVLGTLEAFRVVRAQGTIRATTTANIDLATLTREFGSIENLKVQLGEVDQLKADVAALTTRIAAVEKAQAQTVGFTKTADGYAFAPGGGANVTIHAPNGLTLKGTGVTVNGAANVDVTAGARLTQRASIIALN
jgi:hypothetical protein